MCTRERDLWRSVVYGEWDTLERIIPVCGISHILLTRNRRLSIIIIIILPITTCNDIVVSNSDCRENVYCLFYRQLCIFFFYKNVYIYTPVFAGVKPSLSRYRFPNASGEHHSNVFKSRAQLENRNFSPYTTVSN